MTHEDREKLLDLNEQLCREYYDTDDEAILEKITTTEMLLFHDPDHRPYLDEEFE